MNTFRDEADKNEMKWIDLSASERIIRYSRGIQAGVEDFIIQNVGQLFDDEDDIVNQCCNALKDKRGNKPSPPTVKRWFHVHTAKNASFEVLQSNKGIVIQRRLKEK